MGYATSELGDAAFLASRGHRVTKTERDGSLVTFHFDSLSDQEALGLLSTRERALCKAYHHSWRSVRRLIEAHGNGGAGR